MALDIFKSVEKLNTDAETLSDGGLSNVSEWIDTGSYALNVICSGRATRGIPKGRITGFSGPSGCGKSFFINQIFGNFQKGGEDRIAVLFDSEAAADMNLSRNVGADPSRIKVFPVETVEECKIQVVTLLDSIIANESAHGKVIIGIDSLGNLASKKELDDIAKGKSAADMGLRAKSLKSLMRTITYRAAKSNTTIVFSNHTYDDPAAMYPSMVKQQSGGKGPVYLASLLVQLSLTQEKLDGKKDSDKINPIANKVKGINMKAMTVKNRFAPPFLMTSLALNFVTGLNKYSGLKEMLVGYGVIDQRGSVYDFGTRKLGYSSLWSKDVALWEHELIPALELALEGQLNYNDQSQPADDSLFELHNDEPEDELDD